MNVTPRKWYVVTTDSECVVTDANGKVLCTATAGEQKLFYATTPVVTLSDETATVGEANFKRAALALGLLGGGADSGLPDGYLQAYFLETQGGVPTGDGKAFPYFSIKPPGVNESDDFEFRTVHAASFRLNVAQVEGVNASGDKQASFYGFNNAKRFYVGTSYGVSTVSNYVVDEGKRSWAFKRQGGVVSASYEGQEIIAGKTTTVLYDRMGVFVALRAGTAGSNYPFNGKKYSWTFKKNRKKIIELKPAVDPYGRVCMWDAVGKTPHYNAGGGSFIAGFTLRQARKLGKLAPGSSFTVSLPVGWQEDAGVVEALAQAEANGCTLPVQEYSEGDAAAATYALRRIWVKRTPDALGTYVDADGQRWRVEWCVDVIGADPESLGYERYRSVEVAAEYWGLVPYVAPNAELETLTETE